MEVVTAIMRRRICALAKAIAVCAIACFVCARGRSALAPVVIQRLAHPGDIAVAEDGEHACEQSLRPLRRIGLQGGEVAQPAPAPR